MQKKKRKPTLVLDNYSEKPKKRYYRAQEGIDYEVREELEFEEDFVMQLMELQSEVDAKEGRAIILPLKKVTKCIEKEGKLMNVLDTEINKRKKIQVIQLIN